jgi:N-acetylglucosamine-6-sulfatase
MITLTLCCVIVFIVPINTLPNFVFLVTDDQDLTLRSVGYMQKTIEQVADQGMNFTNFYVNIPICCPSRSTILSGLYPHNSGVVNNSISGGCSSPTWQENHEVSSIAATLKSAKGYKTFYAGKYLNQVKENKQIKII